MNENEYENELSDDEQSQQTMAESYANVVQTNLSRNSKPSDVQDPIDDGIDNPKTVKPSSLNSFSYSFSFIFTCFSPELL
jgi:hypothetical protein